MPSPSWAQETPEPEGLDEPDGLVSLLITFGVLGMIHVSLAALAGQPIRNVSTALLARERQPLGKSGNFTRQDRSPRSHHKPETVS